MICIKKFVVTGIVAFALSAAVITPTFAAGARGAGPGMGRLNGEQKSIIENRKNNLEDLMSGFLEKAAENGIITEDRLSAIKDGLQDETVEMPEFCPRGLFGGTNFADLTDEQKSQIKDTVDEKIEIQKMYIEKAVEVGIITPEQAELMSERIGGRGFGFNCVDLSRITSLNDEQKAVMEQYRAELTEIQLKEIDLYVEFGVIGEESAEYCKEILASGGNFGFGLKNFNFDTENMPERSAEQNVKLRAARTKSL